MISRIKQNSNYHPIDGGKIRTFETILEQIYIPHFPHTAILGSRMSNAANWLQIKSLIQTFEAPSPDYTKITEYYRANGLFENDGIREEKAKMIASIMLSGGIGVKSYLARFFETNNPI